MQQIVGRAGEAEDPVDLANSTVPQLALVDGTVISARSWPDHPAWMRESVFILKQKAPIRELETAA